MRSLLAVAAISLIAGPAFAQTDVPAPKPTPDPDKKICRSITPTGSIMGKRVCHTRAEWKAIADADAANTESALNARRSNGKGPGSE